MYVSYDPEVNVTYVRFVTGTVARTVEIGDLVMVDVDENEQPLGVEFLKPPAKVTQKMVDEVVDRFPSLEVLTHLERWTSALTA